MSPPVSRDQRQRHRDVGFDDQCASDRYRQCRGAGADHDYLRTTTPPTTPTTPSPTGQASGSVTINVLNAPTIIITPPASVQKGVPAAFTFTVTAATSNGSAVKDVSVNWGDGQSQSLGRIHWRANRYPHLHEHGTFVISATVTDVAGGSTPVSTSITVVPLAGTAVIVEPSVFTATTTTAITFTITITPPTGVGIVSSSIDYGDGQVDQLGASTSAKKAHQYATTGQKNVVVSAVYTVVP